MYRNIDVLVATLLFMATFIYIMNTFIMAESNTIKVIRSSIISDAAEVYATYIYSQLGNNFSRWKDKELLEELANADILGGEAKSYVYIAARVIKYEVYSFNGSVFIVSDSMEVVAKTDNFDKAFSNIHTIATRSKIISYNGALYLLILEVVAYTIITS